MKRLLSLVLILVLALSLVACGDTLEGKWEDETGMSVEFTKDEIIMDIGGIKVEGEYKTKGDEMTITIMGASSTGNFELKGDKLYLYDGDIDDADVLKRVD